MQRDLSAPAVVSLARRRGLRRAVRVGCMGQRKSLPLPCATFPWQALSARLPGAVPAFTPPHPSPTLPPQLGYLASWSAHATHRQRHPDAPDPLLPFRAALLEATGLGEEGADSPEPVLRLEWPIFMMLARQPVPPAAA